MAEMQDLLGDQFLYRRLLPDGEEVFSRLKVWENHTIARLIAGCMRIDMSYRMDGMTECAVYVRELPESNVWTCFCFPSVPETATKEDLFDTLDRVVRDMDLSYTRIQFAALPPMAGKTWKPKDP